MKIPFNIKSIFAVLLMGLTVNSALAIPLTELEYPFAEKETDLYETIVTMDSIYFTAYNNCDLKTQSKLLSEDMEFYHDSAGLSTSKEEIMMALEKNICGKVTRELVEGSIEVYEIPDFGAVQMGLHKFHNAEEPDAISKASKFVTIWKKENDDWKITRVISLH